MFFERCLFCKHRARFDISLFHMPRAGAADRRNQRLRRDRLTTAFDSLRTTARILINVARPAELSAIVGCRYHCLGRRHISSSNLTPLLAILRRRPAPTPVREVLQSRRPLVKRSLLYRTMSARGGKGGAPIGKKPSFAAASGSAAEFRFKALMSVVRLQSCSRFVLAYC